MRREKRGVLLDQVRRVYVMRLDRIQLLTKLNFTTPVAVDIAVSDHREYP